ncbi:SprT-like domain-containing protein [Poseidonibacter ostreae]|uniref:SprT domain-containing protein n=1 Tax=Poseidonibacter ostreae TaxID=2654171 RepID=A0A6L4WX61_9BACT|nr:SprT-like domain-containing protein [Poseidonibacter ostreae]KAB7891445.1 sprT domain-containing protein [Poseidonibacter ostreae]
MNKTIPTEEFYEMLQKIYHVFNKELFDSELPNCLITVQRKKRVMGYFSSHRWIDKDENKVHELAINPTYFTSCNFIEVFQTVVHEMVHLWQFELGTPSRRAYHNKEWADKMESLGLMPSSTGREGGKKVGQAMNDYPIKGGAFESVCINLFKEGMFINWFDRFPDENYTPITQTIEDAEDITEDTEHSDDDLDEVIRELYTTVSNVISNPLTEEELKNNKITSSKQKAKYQCPSCYSSVWGKRNLNIKCNDCKVDFVFIT